MLRSTCVFSESVAVRIFDAILNRKLLIFSSAALLSIERKSLEFIGLGVAPCPIPSPLLDWNVGDDVFVSNKKNERISRLNGIKWKSSYF